MPLFLRGEFSNLGEAHGRLTLTFFDLRTASPFLISRMPNTLRSSKHAGNRIIRNLSGEPFTRKQGIRTLHRALNGKNVRNQRDVQIVMEGKGGLGRMALRYPILSSAGS